jgi:hypothetical protein
MRFICISYTFVDVTLRVEPSFATRPPHSLTEVGSLTRDPTILTFLRAVASFSASLNKGTRNYLRPDAFFFPTQYLWALLEFFSFRVL